MRVVACSRPHCHTFPHTFQGPPEEAPPEQCSPELSSIQQNLARLGLDGLSAEELEKAGWAPYVACGHLPLLSSCHPAGAVSGQFIDDITSPNDVWGEGEDILEGCVRH